MTQSQNTLDTITVTGNECRRIVQSRPLRARRPGETTDSQPSSRSRRAADRGCHRSAPRPGRHGWRCGSQSDCLVCLFQRRTATCDPQRAGRCCLDRRHLLPRRSLGTHDARDRRRKEHIRQELGRVAGDGKFLGGFARGATTELNLDPRRNVAVPAHVRSIVDIEAVMLDACMRIDHFITQPLLDIGGNFDFNPRRESRVDRVAPFPCLRLGGRQRGGAGILH